MKTAVRFLKRLFNLYFRFIYWLVRILAKPFKKKKSFIFLLILIVIVGGWFFWNQKRTLNSSNNFNLNFDERAPEGLKLQTEDLCAKGKCVFLGGQNSVKNDLKIKSSPLTLTAWIRPTATASGTLFSFKDKNNQDVMLVNLEKEAKLSVNLKDNVKVGLETPLPLSTWEFVTIVLDEENKSLRLYINASLQSKQEFKDFTKLPDIASFNIGPFIGFLDEVNIYPKALTDKEIIDDNANMILYWRGEK